MQGFASAQGCYGRLMEIEVGDVMSGSSFCLVTEWLPGPVGITTPDMFSVATAGCVLS